MRECLMSDFVIADSSKIYHLKSIFNKKIKSWSFTMLP